MPFALYLLALVVFAMGTSEFMLAGLVPDISTYFGVPVGTAGLPVSYTHLTLPTTSRV